MRLEQLFHALADAFEHHSPIEVAGRDALKRAAPTARLTVTGDPLPIPVLEVLSADDAHPSCALIASTPFIWAPPQTSSDPEYIADSRPKVHVELIGPEGLVESDEIRLGLYGMLPGAEYGIRTHLAEEVFVMLAGEADWKRGEMDYSPLTAGQRSHHPSMMPHANRTRDKAFMSIYVWHGEISTESYAYTGVGRSSESDA